ncbi:hypothetical protein VNO78_00859 [Psophocarpus tetragonolobus]|uniref:Uncharacterized protein n=1 Tax=Psophocarpus tetragonolobus TaxID=3891 RepID=A0AAN9T0X3_PSOTE
MTEIWNAGWLQLIPSVYVLPFDSLMLLLDLYFPRQIYIALFIVNPTCHIVYILDLQWSEIRTHNVFVWGKLKPWLEGENV